MTSSPEQGRQAQPQKIGRYRLTRKLGSGSFATVWQGHDDDLDVPVAVKVLADNWADNDDVRSRFLSEARIMRKIRDPRIVRVYDIGTLPDGRPYFVMDFADGGSLEDLRKKGIGPVQALRLCAEACRALNVLHQHDIVHRDVTPGNLLLNHTSTGEVQVLIADLGVAKQMVGASGATMTAGTPAYMALEQATGDNFDFRADIYSLAAVTYAMLTGRPPFPVRTLADLLSRDPNAVPQPLAQRIGAPPMLDNVLQSSLALQPGRRPPTAAVLADALDQVAASMSAPPGAPPPQPGQSTMRPSPITYPTPSSYLPHSGLTPGSVLGSGGYPVPQGSMAQPQGSMAHPQGSMAQPQGPVPQQGSMVGQPGWSDQSVLAEEDQDAGPTRGRLFYVFVAVAFLALFFVSLLITVLVLN